MGRGGDDCLSARGAAIHVYYVRSKKESALRMERDRRGNGRGRPDTCAHDSVRGRSAERVRRPTLSPICLYSFTTLSCRFTVSCLIMPGDAGEKIESGMALRAQLPSHTHFHTFTCAVPAHPRPNSHASRTSRILYPIMAMTNKANSAQRKRSHRTRRARVAHTAHTLTIVRHRTQRPHGRRRNGSASAGLVCWARHLLVYCTCQMQCLPGSPGTPPTLRPWPRTHAGHDTRLPSRGPRLEPLLLRANRTYTRQR